MKKGKNNTTITIIWIAVVLVVAAGIGYSIRQIRWALATTKTLSKPDPQVAERKPQVETVPEPEPEVEIEVVDAEPTVVEEPVQEEPEVEPEPKVVAEPRRQPWRPGQNMGAVQQFFASLNLNEEEQARLQQGLTFMRQRFESMSPEDQQAEMMRMAEIGWRWGNMTDRQRKAVTQRMSERYEVWRRSDSIELPQLTLD